jgi:hypothetical protein
MNVYYGVNEILSSKVTSFAKLYVMCEKVR